MAEDNDPVILTNENEVEKTQLSEKQPVMKPEKVKSRWRRSSEMECSERRENSPTSLDKQPQHSNSNEQMNPQSNNNIKETVPSYEFLEENLYLFERKRTKRKKEVRRMLCDCSLSKDEEKKGILGCQDECLNRLLMIECGSRCATGDACSNKRFQKRQYAKVEPFKTDKKGWGLRLLEDIPAGSFAIEYVGEVLSRHEFKQRVKQYAREKSNHYYFMALKSDEIIDATNKGNLSRFMNHSCNPNCETQKWTVNGELRIGFFAKRNLKASEEITFDYQFERYGRQAQNCYCESSTCTGYIGLTDEITVDVNTKTLSKKKKSEEKKRESFKDLMLDEEIEKLCDNGGLRNKDDTLLLSRLMVRAEDYHSRVKLLDIILGTSEVACLRLFLDYHGLSLLWSWMAYLTEPELKAKILEVLAILPVPNKTLLLDSKVLSVVEKWALVTDDSAGDAEGSAETASDTDLHTETKKLKTCDTSDSETDNISAQCLESSAALPSSKKEKIQLDCDFIEKHVSETLHTNSNLSPGLSENNVNNNKGLDGIIPRSDEESADTPEEESSKFTKNSEVAVLAKNLMGIWKHLKEDFRIPRLSLEHAQPESLAYVPKKKISPMKINCIPSIDSFRQNNSKYFTTKDSYHSGRNRNKDYFHEDWKRFKKNNKKSFNRSSLPSKAERRLQFAMQIHLKDEEKAIRKQNMENHAYNGVDQSFLNANCTYNSENINYKFPALENGTVYDPAFYSQKSQQQPRPALLPTPGSEPVFSRPPLPPESAGSVYTPNLVYQTQQMPFLSVPPPSIPQQTHVMHCQSNHVVPAPNLISIRNNDSTPGGALPAMTNLATDNSSSTSSLLHPTALYNSTQNSICLSTSSQVLPPSVSTTYVPNQTQFINDQKAVYYVEPQYSEPQSTDQVLLYTDEVHEEIQSKDATIRLPQNWKTATDSEGNLYYYHIITRQTQWDPPDLNEGEDADSETPTYDEPKERKHATHSRRSHKKHTKKKSTTTAPADTSGNPVSLEIAKKIKELFRTKMSAFVIQCLNPYRRDDCQIGRIINNDDFKHLARKLTHFVLAKELKHCKNVEDLDCNDNVKHKARDYIFKYMAKYGKVYRKDKCEIIGKD